MTIGTIAMYTYFDEAVSAELCNHPPYRRIRISQVSVTFHFPALFYIAALHR